MATPYDIRPPASANPRYKILKGAKRSEEHTSELQSQSNLVCRLLLEKKKKHFRSDRESTRLNSSHTQISYALFFLTKKEISIFKKTPTYAHNTCTSSKSDHCSATYY